MKGDVTMRIFRRGLLVVGSIVGVSLGIASPVAGEPPIDKKLVVTAGCNEPGGELFLVNLMPLGGMAFVLDADGEPTGEKLHLLSLDLAGFDAEGQLVFELSKTWGNRTGQTDVIFCSGSFDAGDGVTAFFDALATRR